jgi:NDP-sugar pyrophosphorylase family protein
MIPILDVPFVEVAVAKGDSIDWATRVINVSGPSAPVRGLMARRSEVRVFDEGDHPLGTAATLRELRSELSHTVVTHNCDLLSDLSLHDLIEAHRTNHKACTLAVKSVAERADFSMEDGRVHLLNRHEHTAAGLSFLGAACFERDALTNIGDAVPLGLVEGLLHPLVQDQEVAVYEHEGYARDTGTLGRYLAASIDALDLVAGLVDPPGTMTTDGLHAYVGPGATVNEESLGDGAIVLAGARVESGARLSNCIVWPDSVVVAGTDVTDGIWFEDRVLPV